MFVCSFDQSKKESLHLDLFKMAWLSNKPVNAILTEAEEKLFRSFILTHNGRSNQQKGADIAKEQQAHFCTNCMKNLDALLEDALLEDSLLLVALLHHHQQKKVALPVRKTCFITQHHTHLSQSSPGYPN